MKFGSPTQTQIQIQTQLKIENRTSLANTPLSNSIKSLFI